MATAATTTTRLPGGVSPAASTAPTPVPGGTTGGVGATATTTTTTTTTLAATLASNPFRVRSDDELRQFRDLDEEERQRQRTLQRTLPLHERGCKPRRHLPSADPALRAAETAVKKKPGTAGAGGDPSRTGTAATVGLADLVAARSGRSHALSAQLADRDVERQPVAELVAAKREMFLLQYALEVKRAEMTQLEDAVARETAAVGQLEQRIEAEATQFDQFLRSNDKASANAIRAAEAQQRIKADKTNRVKRLQAEAAALAAENSNQEDTLADLAAHRAFLLALAPPEWRAAQPPGSRALPFAAPAQLLALFSDLETQNLSLITTGQETAALLRMQQDEAAAATRAMEREEAALTAQLAELEALIAEAQARVATARQNASFFRSASTDEQEAEIAAIEAHVALMYGQCIGDNEAHITALQMLTNLESRLEELLEQVATMPPDFVARAQLERERFHRRKARDAKADAERKHQEERRRKALERSMAAPVTHTGKKVMYRSAPPKPKQATKAQQAQQAQEEEDLRYYFT